MDVTRISKFTCHSGQLFLKSSPPGNYAPLGAQMKWHDCTHKPPLSKCTAKYLGLRGGQLVTKLLLQTRLMASPLWKRCCSQQSLINAEPKQ